MTLTDFVSQTELSIFLKRTLGNSTKGLFIAQKEAQLSRSLKNSPKNSPC